MGNQVTVEIRNRHGRQVRVSDNFAAGQWTTLPADAPCPDTDPVGFLASVYQTGNDVLEAALENGTRIDLPSGSIASSALESVIASYEQAKDLETGLPLAIPATPRVRI